MESRIINLVGQLSAEAGSQLYLELKSLLISPHLLLFDATKLANIDEIGWQFLKKCQTKIYQTGSHAAIIGLNQDSHLPWKSNRLLETIPIFQERDSAKKHLASLVGVNLDSTPSSNVNPHPSSHSIPGNKTVSSSTSNTINTSLYCPHCDSILRTYQMGNNSCPSCKGKYFLHKDFKISSFEKVI